MRLGVFGGTFDPIHWGHLGAAIESAYQAGLDKVLLVPAGDPPHKTPVTPIRHRLAMVRLAALEYPALEASDIEARSEGPHYTVNTLRRLHAEHPGAELFLILGTDAYLDLPNWHEPDEIPRLARFIIAEREGIETPLMPAGNAGEYNPGVRPLPAGAVEIRWPGVAVSSSEVRRRVATGAPIEYLVPRSVGDYLKGHRLYL